jgi:hypothetical protein
LISRLKHFLDVSLVVNHMVDGEVHHFPDRQFSEERMRDKILIKVFFIVIG